jgi:hypothetical protein
LARIDSEIGFPVETVHKVFDQCRITSLNSDESWILRHFHFPLSSGRQSGQRRFVATLAIGI